MQLRNTGWAGTKLSDLTTLGYSTFGTAWNGPGGQMTYLTLYLDLNNNGSYDDRIHFEPIYSAAGAGNGNLNPQPAPTLGVWQSWNALQGMWYSDQSNPPNGPGADAITLAAYIAANPTATIVDAAPGVGGIRITSGFASPDDNFDVNVDAFKIGTVGGTTTYDFELSAVPEAGAFWLGAIVCSVVGLVYGGRALVRRKTVERQETSV